MKLAAHYNKASIIASITVLLIGAVVYFFAINYITRTQFDRDLGEEVAELFEYVSLHNELPKPVDFDQDQTMFQKTGIDHINTRFFDTVFTNKRVETLKGGRAVEGIVKIKNTRYKFTIIISKAGTVYLVQIITAITLVLLVALIVILFLINRFVLSGLWRPFYGLVNHLKVFNVSEGANFKLGKTEVDEFKELHHAIEVMSSRVKDDFQNLKQFTENASHEMMTPLAVITSKLDTLIQDESLKPEQYEQITDIYGATGKLSRLNQSLLLLVKIENNLIDDAEQLSLDVILGDKLRQFQELIVSKDLQVVTDLRPIQVKASKYLVDILLNNLISNAIRHNNYGGTLNVTVLFNKVIIQNNGLLQCLNAERVFDRFQKGSKSDGTGLGLTIAKNICKMYNWDLAYDYRDSFHRFQITFL